MTIILRFLAQILDICECSEFWFSPLYMCQTSKARNIRFERKGAKRRNVNAFAEHLFGVMSNVWICLSEWKTKKKLSILMQWRVLFLQIWSDGFDFSGKHTSWFEKQYSRVSKRNRNGRQIPQSLDKSKTTLLCLWFLFYGWKLYRDIVW